MPGAMFQSMIPSWGKQDGTPRVAAQVEVIWTGEATAILEQGWEQEQVQADFHAAEVIKSGSCVLSPVLVRRQEYRSWYGVRSAIQRCLPRRHFLAVASILIVKRSNQYVQSVVYHRCTRFHSMSSVISLPTSH
jgi:hypothetical protein